MELLTSTASTKRIINSIFILWDFFSALQQVSNLFTFLCSLHGCEMNFFPSSFSFLWNKINLSSLTKSEVDSAKATLELRDLFELKTNCGRTL